MIGFNQESLYKFNMKAFDIGGIFKSIYYYLFKHSLFTIVNKNAKLNTIVDPSKKVYVCALGPSLKQVDLSKIDGDSIVVNRFFKIGKDFPSFVPTYYVMVDTGFSSYENKRDFKEALDTYLPQGTIFFLNSLMEDSDILKGYDLTNIYFVSCFRGSVHADKKYSLDKPLPVFQNVVGAAIFIIMLLGYKDISLLGCDFNSFASRKRIHCYQDKSEDRPFSLSWELFVYSRAAKDHEDIQQYATVNNVKIVNSTKDSLIDAYQYEIEEKIYKQL